MKVLIIGAKPQSLTIFRGQLLRTLVADGHEVFAMADSSDCQTVATLESWGVIFSPYHVRRTGLNPISDARTCVELFRAMKRIRPDVVLAYTIKPVIWGGIAARFFRRQKFFPLITGLGYTFTKGGFVKQVLRRVVIALYSIALRDADAVIFQNLDNQNTFVDEGITTRHRCRRVGGSGVDLKQFDQHPIPPSPPVVFLCIARLLIDKGINEFAQAAKLVRKRDANVKFILVGEQDPSPNRIDPSSVAGWGKTGDVEYLGGMDDVRPALRQCHVFVLPSYHEGLPRTVLEAMSVGRPIITTDAVGCRDTVTPEENGLLIEPASVDSLVAAVTWFVENPAAWQKFGTASRRLVEEKFDVHEVNRRLIEIMGLSVSC